MPGTIDGQINFIVTKDGKVGTLGGTTRWFPSHGVYSYTKEGYSKPLEHKLAEIKETTIDRLQGPMDRPVPAVKPQ